MNARLLKENEKEVQNVEETDAKSKYSEYDENGNKRAKHEAHKLKRSCEASRLDLGVVIDEWVGQDDCHLSYK